LNLAAMARAASALGRVQAALAAAQRRQHPLR
jgi:hypothetical protein